MPLLAGALAALGAAHALVVHGEPGMDEISPMGPTHVAEVRDGAVTEWTIDPADYGFSGFAPGSWRAGARRTTRERSSKCCGGTRSAAAVVLNAAARSTSRQEVVRADCECRRLTHSGAGRGRQRSTVCVEPTQVGNATPRKPAIRRTQSASADSRRDGADARSRQRCGTSDVRMRLAPLRIAAEVPC